MSRPIETTAAAVEQALAGCSSSLVRVGATSWSFALSNGAALPANAILDDGWVSITMGLDHGSAVNDPSDLHRALQVGPDIPGRGRPVIAPGSRGISLVADLPVHKHTNPSDSVAAACSELERGADTLRGIQATADDPPRPAQSQGHKVDVPGLCEQAGWPCKVRSSGRLAVDLETPGSFFQAEIEDRGASGLVARAPLCEWVSLSPVCRHAVNVFLLSACGGLKSVRPGIRESDGRTTAILEVVLPGEPGADELNEALAILSVACSVCGREAACLADDFVAGTYLAARGWN